MLPADARAPPTASCFVNPLTALSMVETMRMEGHKALVHTAAASNLGQMLNRICIKDGVPLVNIVRSAEQEKLLRGIGAKHVCDSTAPDFMEKLTAALIETGATLAFDAIGGGRPRLADSDLHGSLGQRHGEGIQPLWFDRAQAGLYLRLARHAPDRTRPFFPGMAWGVGGWLFSRSCRRPAWKRCCACASASPTN